MIEKKLVRKPLEIKPEEIRQKYFKEERALFCQRNLKLTDCIFDKGESPLKECSDISLYNSSLCFKYPLWYCRNVYAEDCTWFENARAGVWYTDNVTVKNAVIKAPKNFRRCKNVTLESVDFTDAKETLWHCSGIKLSNVFASGDYFLMDSENIAIDGLRLDGKYSFDGVKNVIVRNSRLVTKDAFWNSENVTVYDSFISSEYLGWNSKNVTLINCTIESLQGLCYIDGIKLVNCKLLNTTLAFERSENIDAEIVNRAESVFDPASGTIKAAEIGELIITEHAPNQANVKIECDNIDRRLDAPDWSEL